MQAPYKETVIVVHGTWAAPVANRLAWYNSGNDTKGFVSELNAALQARASSARCWLHCDEDSEPFYWSGENSWVARSRAAEQLVEYVARLRKDGWICHVVAHSHGGNIIAEALPILMVGGHAPLGQFVTLGTPFIDVVTPPMEKEKERHDYLLGIALMLCVFQICESLQASEPLGYVLPGYLLLMIISRWRQLHLNGVPLLEFFAEKWKSIALQVFVWLCAGIILSVTIFSPYRTRTSALLGASGLAVLMFALARHHRRERKRRPAKLLLPNATTNFLALGSSKDEAWQVLHHMRAIENPLSVKTGLSRYLLDSLRAGFEQRRNADRLYYGSVGKLGYAAPLLAVGFYVFLAVWAWLTFFFFPMELMGSYSARVLIDTETQIGAMLVAALTLVIMAILLLGDKFLAAMLLPFRWVARIKSALDGAIFAVGFYVMRRESWPVVLKIAMGLEGYGFAVPTVEQWPTQFSEEVVTYENIPPDAERIATQHRNAWISEHLQTVSDTFSKPIVTPVDISTLLEKIESDQTLVHAAYYTNDECIGRIADWIAFGRSPGLTTDRAATRTSGRCEP